MGAWENQKPEWTRPGFFIDPMSNESPRSADLWKTKEGTLGTNTPLVRFPQDPQIRRRQPLLSRIPT